MRRFIAGNAALFEQVCAVELRQLEYQRSTDERSERVFDYMEAREAPRHKVFFDGQVYDVFELPVAGPARRARGRARGRLRGRGHPERPGREARGRGARGVDAPRHAAVKRDADTFNAQCPQLEVRHTAAFHDRSLVLDGA